ncbi:MAG: rhodanese-like domain-containing protein [Armatimonadetes bacterium]|nr:rhodanese-like domain-containing protein [Armatimonadota bacterium]
MKQINPTIDTTLPCADVFNLLSEGKVLLIDVRGYDEFARGHADGAKCIPLPELERRANEISGDLPVCVMCASGNRSAMAAERLRALGMNQVVDVCGGMKAWTDAGLPAQENKGIIPLEQQVRGVAGFLVFTFTLASLLLHRGFAAGSLFVGFMLFLSSVTGWCPMLLILKVMPWNRLPQSRTSSL